MSYVHLHIPGWDGTLDFYERIAETKEKRAQPVGGGRRVTTVRVLMYEDSVSEGWVAGTQAMADKARLDGASVHELKASAARLNADNAYTDLDMAMLRDYRRHLAERRSKEPPIEVRP